VSPLMTCASLSSPAHVLPIVKPHMPGDQRPVPHPWSEPRDVVRGADGDAGDVLVEPGSHLVPHDAGALLRIGLDGEALDELVELGMLHEQIQRGLAVATADENLPELRGHQRGGIGQRHTRVRPRPEVRHEDRAIQRTPLDPDAHLLPVRRHGLSDVREEATPGPGRKIHRHVEPVRIARLGEQRPGSGRIVGIRLLQCVRVPRVVRVGEPGAQHSPKASEHALHDGLLVHRQVECQPHLARALGVRLCPRHLRVVRRLGGPLAAQNDVEPGHVGHHECPHAHLLQLVNVLSTDLDHVDAARPQHGHARGRLGYFQKHEALPLGRRPPVVLHPLVDDPFAADVLHEFEGTRRDRVPFGSLFPDALDVALGLDEGHRREQSLGHLVAEHDGGLVEAHGDGVAILDFDALDQAELRRQRVGGALLDDGLEGELDVLGREFHPIVEADSFAQRKSPGAATIQNLPPLGQHGRQLAGLGIAGQQILEDGLQDHVLGTGIELRQPALSCEGGNRHRESPFRLGRRGGRQGYHEKCGHEQSDDRES
jgi:hypothetical protein